MLLEKAGMDGDSTAYDNILYNKIQQYEEEMEELSYNLEDKEEYYYSKFTAMETYINQMNAQLEAIMSMSNG